MRETKFNLQSPFQPAGDQPKAIAALSDGIQSQKNHQTLLGVTGSGKTFTIAHVIAKTQKPTLVLAHNKTLAAQLCAEFRDYFPENAVEYFVSYYDYYQPEAYIAARDLYIEKEADINEEIERLRHCATQALLTRRNVIIVASVSAIYGLGMPEEYLNAVIMLQTGNTYSRKELLLKLDRVKFERNDTELKRGRYKVKGDTLEIYPASEDHLIRLEFFGETLEQITRCHPVTKKAIEILDHYDIFPATHYVVQQYIEPAIQKIEMELAERAEALKKEEKLLESQRLTQRTRYDIELMREIGYCKGIENYSRHLSNRAPNEPPGVLLDFFPKDYLTVIDESHVTIPQVRGMYHGDRSRKTVLIEHGFRLPSAMDNRPLTFDEFEQKTNQVIYVSATPSTYELEKSKNPDGTINLVEQIIRPTGLVDPEVQIQPTKNQIDHLLIQIKQVISKKERVLITTLTKKMAEELSDYITEQNIRVRYLHSDILALDRIDILHDLRLGTFDVLVGVNLLREGLDLPEVSLVAIMDADKEGFLRNERSLIQTIGRAARNVNGRVILYADHTTHSMAQAVSETNRRRTIQLAHNRTHNITPQTIIKKISDIRDEDRKLIQEIKVETNSLKPEQLPKLIKKLETEMQRAAKALQFELAAVLRDQIEELKNKKMAAPSNR